MAPADNCRDWAMKPLNRIDDVDVLCRISKFAVRPSRNYDSKSLPG